jgi:rod shape-determining protein MreD
MTPTRFIVWLPAISFLVALSLEVMPMSDGLAPWRPPWVALTVIYWSMHRPGRIGVGIAWLLGLTLDVLQGAVLGQHALSLAVAAFLTIKLCQRLRVFPIWHQTVSVGILVAVYSFLNFWIDGMTGNQIGGFARLTPTVSALLVWPVMRGLGDRLLARS